MKTVFLLCTFSLVVCLALCSNENEKAEDQGKHSKEILDREKRDAMPQPRGGGGRGGGGRGGGGGSRGGRSGGRSRSSRSRSRGGTGSGGVGGDYDYGDAGVMFQISKVLAIVCIFGSLAHVTLFR